MKVPPRLRNGDTIGVLAPASPPSEEWKTIRGLEYLRRKRFQVKKGTSLSLHNGYLAGSDTERADDVHAMFRDSKVRAIFANRGGFGCGRILSMLDYTLIAQHPKILTGYSDVTALSLALFTKCNLVTFAGPMVAVEMNGKMDTWTEEMFWSILMRSRHSFTIRFPPASYDIISRPGIATGTLLGGNLAVLVSLLGTPYEPDWRNAILFLEDVGENVYKIDRMLCQLRDAGILKRIRGVMLGSFSSIPEDIPNRDLNDVLSDYFLPLEVPIMGAIPFGHMIPKATLPLGATVRMNVGHRLLTVLQRVVL